MTKSKKIVLYVLIATLVLSFGLLSFTTAKYITKMGNSGSNVGDKGDIPYALLDTIEVRTQEDFFNAVSKGYPYIRLADTVRDPLIVTQDTMSVNKSLVIDLNGKHLERISSEALLTVPQGVTLTIIDSSKNATGGLYNPVGTVLHISGGSLNVRGGKYESGPRTWEYYTLSEQARFGEPTVTSTDSNEAKVLYKHKDTDGKTTIKETKFMPIISPEIKKNSEGDIIELDGNIYFDKAYEYTNAENKTEVLIPADTYCFYVTSDGFTSGTTIDFDVTTADFSYTYYVDPKNNNDSYNYHSAPTAETSEKPANLVEVTVYGFTKNIQTAMGWGHLDTAVTVDKGVNQNPEKPTDVPWYAAVKMEGGTLNVDCVGSTNFEDASSGAGGTTGEGTNTKEATTDFLKTKPEQSNFTKEFDYKYFGKGSFISYFGVETTSCVQFTGGNMKVSTEGVFATVNPKTIATINDINNISIAKEENKKYALSSEGRSVVIHNNGKGTGDGGELTIDGGTFLTYNMSVVRLMKGHCTVNNSNLYRVQNTDYYRYYTTLPDKSKVRGHIYGTGTLYTAGGNIDVNNAKIWISSVKELTADAAQNITDFEGAYGIYSVKGVVNATDLVVYADGDCCRGIYSNPDQFSQSLGTGPTNTGGDDGEVNTSEVILHNPKMFVSGKRTFGIYSRGGTVIISAEAPEVIDGVLTYNSRFFVTGEKTMGIYAIAPKDTVGRNTKAVEMQNTRIRLNKTEDAKTHKPVYYVNNPGDFNVAINSIDADLLFDNVNIESSAYGVTCLNGGITMNDIGITAKAAPAIIVKGQENNSESGKITVKGKVDIDCYVKKDYVAAVPNLWKEYLPEGKKDHNYLNTHSAIDIQGGFLEVTPDLDNNPDDFFDVIFDTDIETPRVMDRIAKVQGKDWVNKMPYVDKGTLTDEWIIFSDDGQMWSPSAFLPTVMSAIRVAGSNGYPALTITSTSNIIAKRGAGIIVRGGDVTLGDKNNSQTINIQAQAGCDINRDGEVNLTNETIVKTVDGVEISIKPDLDFNGDGTVNLTNYPFKDDNDDPKKITTPADLDFNGDNLVLYDDFNHDFDFNNDGEVNLTDHNFIKIEYDEVTGEKKETTVTPDLDFNGDGVVDLTNINEIVKTVYNEETGKEEEIRIQPDLNIHYHLNKAKEDKKEDKDRDKKVDVNDFKYLLQLPYYTDATFSFMGKADWKYCDTRLGGDAMFVSGGNVTSEANELTLNAVHGNGLFVTGASITPDADFKYKGRITIADKANAPEVIIDAGTFMGDAHPYMVREQNRFNFTGPSSFYGVKVVSGGTATINGGTFGGYGAVCTMGVISTDYIPATLNINGAYNGNRITMSGKRDVACFYNQSDVSIESIDKPFARIETATSTKFNYEYADDFGIAIPNGINTAMVIETYVENLNSKDEDLKKEAEQIVTTSDVTINGGYYRATVGDGQGAKAIWCSSPKATLTVNGGHFIGSEAGGAIQQAQALAHLYLNGGYFYNYAWKAVLTGAGAKNYTLGTDASGKQLQFLGLVAEDDQNKHYDYFHETDKVVDIFQPYGVVYIKGKQVQPRE